MSPSAARSTATCLLGLTILTGCAVRSFEHDPRSAARSAVEFARVSFVQGDTGAAYSLLSEDARRTTSIEKFREMIAKMHPRTHPALVGATEFEPIPGQEGMNIFVHGQNGEEHFSHRLVMQGSAGARYKVSGLWRGSGPHPPSKLRRPL